MGKLEIRGRAEKEFEYDLMEIVVSFDVQAKSSAEAIRKMTAQCEECLSIINEQIVPVEEIRVGEDAVEQIHIDGELKVHATRKITMRLPFDVSVSNYFLELISEKEYDVDFNIDPILSKSNEIHNELIRRAVEDSKVKATAIADVMNQKIVGIDSVQIGNKYYDDEFYLCRRADDIPSSKFHFSNKLKAPTVTEYESVVVVWNIE